MGSDLGRLSGFRIGKLDAGINLISYLFPPLAIKVLGLYILLADDTEEGFENDSDGWTPALYDWQQTSANVLFFTFIHPATMEVPPSFRKLSDTRREGGPGSVPKDTVIIFAIGIGS